MDGNSAGRTHSKKENTSSVIFLVITLHIEFAIRLKRDNRI